jgi:glycosyltransferase involved in cell wall biosynthesis
VWYYAELKRTKPVRWLDARMELNVLTRCDAIITVGQRLVDDFKKKIGHGQKISLHSMGYDESLFTTQGNVPSHAFVIAYTGILASNYNPGAVFKALASLLGTHPDWKIELHFYGLIAPEIKAQIVWHGLGHIGHFHGYVPHSESISALLSSSALLLISPDIPHADMIIPGKIYEYMASGRPIIHLGGAHSDTANILDDCSAGPTFSRTEIHALTQHLERLYLTWLQNPDDLIRRSQDHFKYGRDSEAKNLASFLQSNFT